MTDSYESGAHWCEDIEPEQGIFWTVIPAPPDPRTMRRPAPRSSRRLKHISKLVTTFVSAEVANANFDRSVEHVIPRQLLVTTTTRVTHVDRFLVTDATSDTTPDIDDRPEPTRQ